MIVLLLGHCSVHASSVGPIGNSRGSHTHAREQRAKNSAAMILIFRSTKRSLASKNFLMNQTETLSIIN